MRRVAAELNDGKPLDAVIHNAGVWSGRAVMPVNIIAPYLLTALLGAPRRLVYLSSGSHFGGRPSLAGVDWRGEDAGSYSDSMLFVTTLAAAVARLRRRVLSNAVDPAGCPIKMGGPSAPDDLELGHRTQEWLVASDEPQALTTGGYWYHHRQVQPHAAVHDAAFQDRLLRTLTEQTGTALSSAESCAVWDALSVHLSAKTPSRRQDRLSWRTRTPCLDPCGGYGILLDRQGCQPRRCRRRRLKENRCAWCCDVRPG